MNPSVQQRLHELPNPRISDSEGATVSVSNSETAFLEI